MSNVNNDGLQQGASQKKSPRRLKKRDTTRSMMRFLVIIRTISKERKHLLVIPLIIAILIQTAESVAMLLMKTLAFLVRLKVFLITINNN